MEKRSLAMKKYFVLFIIVLAMICLSFVNLFSEEAKYHFVRIDGLAEQVVAEKILKDIYNQAGITIDIEAVPGGRAIMLATTGKSDGETLRIFSYGEKYKMMIRVPTPYSSLETTVFAKKSSNIDIKNKADLAKYKIVIVRGVQHTIDITEGLDTVHVIDTVEQMMKFLNLDRADIAITNNISGVAVLKKLKLTADIIPLITLETLDLFHYLHETHKDIVPTVDEVIQKMVKSGELKKLREKYEKEYLDNI
ncbi:MAG: transporter substrate-binding domain-containing protein [Desulfamplus sp.]|nr:transporter substrate-binding domain-containing protein [Desulfamplus sp.]